MKLALSSFDFIRAILLEQGWHIATVTNLFNDISWNYIVDPYTDEHVLDGEGNQAKFESEKEAWEALIEAYTESYCMGAYYFDGVEDSEIHNPDDPADTYLPWEKMIEPHTDDKNRVYLGKSGKIIRRY